MKLMMIVLLYFVCASMIRGVLLKVFGGKYPSGNVILVVSLLAIFWPIWPEIAVVALFGFVVIKFIAFCNDNQRAPEH